MKKILSIIVLLFPSILFAVEPYDLKGDVLGMDLISFKEKHRRSVSGGSSVAPFCSDSRPKMKINTLLSEEWHDEAGIVSCRTTYPFEQHRRSFKKPTVAGVSTELLLYHFTDGKLFKITVWLKHDGFMKVKSALLTKYGKQSSSDVTELKNRFGATFSSENIKWNNNVSSIELVERHGRIDSTALLFRHNELNSIARSKQPKPKVDDL